MQFSFGLEESVSGSRGIFLDAQYKASLTWSLHNYENSIYKQLMLKLSLQLFLVFKYIYYAFVEYLYSLFIYIVLESQYLLSIYIQHCPLWDEQNKRILCDTLCFTLDRCSNSAVKLEYKLLPKAFLEWPVYKRRCSLLSNYIQI